MHRAFREEGGESGGGRGAQGSGGPQGWWGGPQGWRGVRGPWRPLPSGRGRSRCRRSGAVCVRGWRGRRPRRGCRRATEGPYGGPFWPLRGPPFGPLGPPLWPLGPLLGPSGPLLGPLRALEGGFRGICGAFGGVWGGGVSALWGPQGPYRARAGEHLRFSRLWPTLRHSVAFEAPPFARGGVFLRCAASSPITCMRCAAVSSPSLRGGDARSLPSRAGAFARAVPDTHRTRSNPARHDEIPAGGVPEWLKGTDCKSVGSRLRWFESSPLHHEAPRLEASLASHAGVAQW